MSKTTNAVEIARNRSGKSPQFQQRMDEERVKSLAARTIYEARTAAGWTQKQLAEKIGTQQPVIARLEDADYEGHTVSMLQRIAAAFDKRIEIRFAPYGTACAEDASTEEQRAEAA